MMRRRPSEKGSSMVLKIASIFNSQLITKEAVLNLGPEGPDLPENQCMFIRGFRVSRTLWKFPRRLKAAGSPSTDWDDREPDIELISIPATTKYRDPLHILLDFIVERAHECDMILVHDDDLERIHGISEGTSLGSLQPEMVMDILRRSNIEIHKVCRDLSPITGVPNSEAGVVWVTMLSKLSQDWSAVSLSQQLRHTAQDPDTHHIGPLPATAMVDSKMFTPYVPNAIKVRNRSTPAQLAVLEGVFVTDKKPNAPKRKNLAKKVGLSPRDVQVWFQNRRAEEKKALTKKGPSPTSPSSSTGVTTASAATVPDTAVTTDASPCPEATPEGLADPVPPPPDTSTMTEIEPQTFDRSTSTLQSPPWRPESEPITEMFDSSGNISERMLYRQLPTPPRSAYASPTYPLDVPSPHPGPCNIARRRRPQHPEPPTNDPP